MSLLTGECMRSMARSKRPPRHKRVKLHVSGALTPRGPEMLFPKNSSKDSKRGPRSGTANFLKKKLPVAGAKQRICPKGAGSAQQKLLGARFRQINEFLYSSDSASAFNHFKNNLDEFERYHQGWRLQQQKGWPVNPVDVIRRLIFQASSGKESNIAIADMGCGEAALMKSVSSNPRYTVHSFDLVSQHPAVVACDISRTPLPSSSVDFAVFSLSLMNTNYGDSLAEAARILRTGGKVFIAEVESRFSEESCASFVKCMERLGFAHLSTDRQFSVFIIFQFQLSRHSAPHTVSWPSLKACQYKRR